MSMLAAPRRKQKWTLNPRGKDWSEDSNKFGQKMLEKMGWSSGKGLGAKGQGMVEHVRVRVKNDQLGIGYTKDKDDQWTEHQDDFNSFLQNLQKEQAAESSDVTEETNKALSGKSLEEKSKQSQKRVHYKKFTRGKDVSKYSTKDLANIFGKKDLNEKSKEVEEEDDLKIYDPVGTKDTTAGIITYKGGNMNEYFNKKLDNGELTNVKVEVISDSEDECRTGFGFSQPKSRSKFYVNDDTNIEEENTDSKTEKYKGLGFLKSSETKTKNKKLNNLNYVFDNPCLDLNILDNSVEIKSEPIGEDFKNIDKITPKKRKSECIHECEEVDLDTLEKPKVKKQKKEFSYDNAGLDLNFSDNNKIIIKKDEIIPEKSKFLFRNFKKQNKSQELAGCYTNLNESNNCELKIKIENPEVVLNGIENPALNSECTDSLTLKKDEESNHDIEIVSNDLENPALDLEYPDRPTPKSSKKKNKDIEIISSGIENPGLDLECPDRPTPKKSKKKNQDIEIIPNGIENPALDLQCPERPTPKKSKKKNKDVEIITGGIENPALDLDCPDKPTLKKSKKKNKEVEIISSGIENPGLDLECPDRPTPKKSKKKNQDVEIISNGIDNPALDLQCPDKPTPKKNKRKSNDVEEVCSGFENPGLDLEYPDRQTPKKAKRSNEIKISSGGLENPGLDLEFPGKSTAIEVVKEIKNKIAFNGFENPGLNLNYSENQKSTDFEVLSVRHGLQNSALDLSDECSHKKRVTFNDEVEIGTDSVNKKKKKLDKYEVVNEKLKKKKVAEPVAFVNEGLDLQVIQKEEIDNEINERRSKKCKRKKERRISHLATIEETPEEEIVNESIIEEQQQNKDLEIVDEHLCDDVQEITCEESSPKKKNKKKKKKKHEEEEINVVETENIVEQEEKETLETNLTEEKVKKNKKKRDKAVSVENEDSNENGKENFCGEKSDVKDPSLKKKSKKKKTSSEEVVSLEEFLSEENIEDQNQKVEEKTEDSSTAVTETQRTENRNSERNNFQRTNSFRKPKEVMRSLFFKNPTLLFNGSNINEIRGYGSHMYNNH